MNISAMPCTPKKCLPFPTPISCEQHVHQSDANLNAGSTFNIDILARALPCLRNINVFVEDTTTTSCVRDGRTDNLQHCLSRTKEGERGTVFFSFEIFFPCYLQCCPFTIRLLMSFVGWSFPTVLDVHVLCKDGMSHQTSYEHDAR